MWNTMNSETSNEISLFEEMNFSDCVFLRMAMVDHSYICQKYQDEKFRIEMDWDV